MSWRMSVVVLLVLFTQWGCPQFQENHTSPNNANNTDNQNNINNQNNSPDMMNDMPLDLGDLEVRSCKATITFNGAQSASAVAVAGEFNDWDSTATPLQRVNGLWTAEVDFQPGEYAYKFVIDGEYEGNPPAEVPTKWAGNFENRNLIVPNCDAPGWRVASNSISSDGTVRATLKFLGARSGARIDAGSLQVQVGGVDVEPMLNAETGVMEITYKAPKYGKYSIKVWAKDTDGKEAEEYPLWLPQWYEEKPFDWRDATMYLIFTDRFLDTDSGSPVAPINGTQQIAGYMGGDFKGIIDKIEAGYFNEMGVNLLWLSPIYENTEEAWIGGDGVNYFTGYHGYWPIDPLNAETRFGDSGGDANTRLQELINKAHERGIRVLFDVVHNHVHKDHVWCKEKPEWCQVTCTCGANGCSWDALPLICQFAPYLPDLSYRNHEILQRQVKDTVKLGEKFDIDGFRVDAAKHMDHIIMRRLRYELNQMEKRNIAPFYTVGETFTGGDGYALIMEYVADHELHGQFDFPLLYPIRGTFGHSGSFRELEAAVIRSEQAYGDAYFWMSPFLGNHDIPRFVTDSVGNSQGPWGQSPDIMAEGPADSINDGQWNIINRMSMGFAFLLTQPGVPLLYYGDEIGLAGAGDPDNRRMMDWSWNMGQQELINRVRTLGKARQALEPLRRGKRVQLWVDDDLYVYARQSAPGQVVIIAMNKGNTMRQEEVTIPNNMDISNKTMESYNSDRTLVINNTTTRVTLNPWEYAIFYLKTN